MKSQIHEFLAGKNRVTNKTKLLFTFLFSACTLLPTVSSAQEVLFDFNNAPLYTSLPIDQTVGGITAHLFATSPWYNYSIQSADALGFTPPGFDGHIIYPNTVYLADLAITFDQPITDFSIMYCCEELGCDDAATMRVTTYMNGSFTGTLTKTASNPGTWPVDTLKCNFPLDFDSVVIHYDSPPPTCQDYGVIFLADNMRVTAAGGTAIADPSIFIKGLIIPNPVSQSATISFSLLQSENMNVTIYDITGRFIKNLFDGRLSTGEHQINWDVNDDAVAGGLYFLKLSCENFSRSYKIVVLK